MTDKEFFKNIKHEAKEYGSVFYESFPYWVLQIYNIGMTYDDLENAVDGLDHNDDSIDAFWISDEDREINIVQCKSADSEKDIRPCKKEWLSYLYDVKKKLTNNDYIAKHKNTRIQEIASDFSIAINKNYKIIYSFYHLGYLPENNKKIIQSYNKDNVLFNYYGLTDIQDQWNEYNSRISLTDPKYFEFIIDDNKNHLSIINAKIGQYHTLIGLVDGYQLIKLREEHKYRLFDKNVRFNLGKNKINEKIIETAKKDPTNFYFYNNGITITCNSFKYRENTQSVRVEYPQIINGAQTVDSLYEAYNKKHISLKLKYANECEAENKIKADFQKIRVMFRIIQSESHDSEFALKVIKYNNSQNSIQIRDFFANRDEQIELQNKLSEAGYFYEIKRGERNYIKKEPHIRLKKKISEFSYNERKMNIENVASSYRAFLGAPSSKEVGSKKILEDDNTYYELFGSNRYDVSEERVNRIILSYNLFEILENESRTYKKILVTLPKVEQDVTAFNTLKENIVSSCLFNEIVKNKFVTYDEYLENKDSVNEKLREFYPFTQGKYQVLALFNLILHKCKYIESIYKYNCHNEYEFLKERIVKNWLPTCLDHILVPIYKKVTEEEAISMNAFYLRSSSFEKFKKKFSKLDMDLGKEFIEIFPLNFNE